MILRVVDLYRIELKNLSKAFQLLEGVMLELAKQVDPDIERLCSYLNELGILKYYLEDFGKAKIYFMDALYRAQKFLKRETLIAILAEKNESSLLLDSAPDELESIKGPIEYLKHQLESLSQEDVLLEYKIRYYDPSYNKSNIRSKYNAIINNVKIMQNLENPKGEEIALELCKVCQLMREEMEEPEASTAVIARLTQALVWLPEDHIAAGGLWYQIGELYKENGDLKMTIECLIKCLDIKLNGDDTTQLSLIPFQWKEFLENNSFYFSGIPQIYFKLFNQYYKLTNNEDKYWHNCFTTAVKVIEYLEKNPDANGDLFDINIYNCLFFAVEYCCGNHKFEEARKYLGKALDTIDDKKTHEDWTCKLYTLWRLLSGETALQETAE